MEPDNNNILLYVTIFIYLSLISFLTIMYLKYYISIVSFNKYILNCINFTLIILPLYLLLYKINVYYKWNYVIIITIICWSIIIDFVSYYLHKLLHVNKFLYNQIHYLHHYNNQYNIFDSQYVHILETFFVTMPSFWLFPCIVFLINRSFNGYSFILMLLITIYYNIKSHAFKGPHMYHHEFQLKNFGVLYIFDILQNNYFNK